MACLYDVSDDGGKGSNLYAIEAEPFYKLRMLMFLNSSTNLMGNIVRHLLEPVRIYKVIFNYYRLIIKST